MNKIFLKSLKNDNGQAFFEMIVFIPFMIFLFVIIVTFGNSINGAINQNKVLRSYFYHFLKQDSYMPSYDDLNTLAGKGVTQVGLYSIGWRESSDGESSVAACYKVKRFFGGATDEKCDEAPAEPDKTSFIRLFTFYGICSATYRAYDATHYELMEYYNNSSDACLNYQN